MQCIEMRVRAKGCSSLTQGIARNLNKYTAQNKLTSFTPTELRIPHSGGMSKVQYLSKKLRGQLYSHLT